MDGQQQALMEENPDHPVFTLLFDCEGYTPAFFKRLWNELRIAVITYRKNVKDSWNEALFLEQEVETNMGVAKIKLAEQETLLGGCSLREVRKLSDEKHLTSIVTTNQILPLRLIAAYMLGRSRSEEFFSIHETGILIR